MHQIGNDLEPSDGLRRKLLLTIWSGTVLGIPLWWLLGLNLFVYHFTASILLISSLLEAGRASKKLRVPPIALFLILIGTLYLVSILLHAGSYRMDRVMAAVYNLSFWFLGAMLVVVLSFCYSSDFISKFLRNFVILGVVNSILVLVGLIAILNGIQELGFTTPLHGLTDITKGSPLVDYSLRVRLLTRDWFAFGLRSRLNLYTPYPTATGAFLVISLIMLLTWASIKKKVWNGWFLLAFVMNLLGLFMTLSRMSIVAFFATGVLLWILQKKKTPIWILAFALCGIVLIPWILQAIEHILLTREGSTYSRIDLYLYSIGQLRGIDWILGFGIKPRLTIFSIPLGSHSTYVSLLYKTGVLGLAFFLVFQIVLISNWYRLKAFARNSREHLIVWRGFGMVFISMPLWMLTEDIDAPQVIAFLYFSCIGVFEGFRRVIQSCPSAENK